MRISPLEYDPGYRNHRDTVAAGYTYLIFLNGKHDRMAVAADDATGEVIRPLFVGGMVQFDPANPRRFLTETVRGHVKIVRRFPAPENWRLG